MLKNKQFLPFYFIVMPAPKFSCELKMKHSFLVLKKDKKKKEIIDQINSE